MRLTIPPGRALTDIDRVLMFIALVSGGAQAPTGDTAAFVAALFDWPEERARNAFFAAESLGLIKRG